LTLTTLPELNSLFGGFTITKKKSEVQEAIYSTADWVTPSFVQIKKKITKRISPYLENEL
jgi:hypothetical protein